MAKIVFGRIVSELASGFVTFCQAVVFCRQLFRSQKPGAGMVCVDGLNVANFPHFPLLVVVSQGSGAPLLAHVPSSVGGHLNQNLRAPA